MGYTPVSQLTPEQLEKRRAYQRSYRKANHFWLSRYMHEYNERRRAEQRWLKGKG